MPNVDKPRGGGAAFGLPIWLRSRLHAGEPHGGLFQLRCTYVFRFPT